MEERVPEIRFKGFEGPWEKNIFEEVVKRLSELSTDASLPRVEYEDIVSGIGTINKDLYQKNSHKSGIKFHKGDVLYGKLRPYLQNWLLAFFDGIAVGDFWVLQPQGIDSGFLYRLIQGRKFSDIANQSTGTKMPRADWKLVSKTAFFIPQNVNEQFVIGDFFINLDSLIISSEQKLGQLKIFKKACLEKMFPKEGETVPEIRFKGFEGPWKKCTLGDVGKARSGIGFPDSEQGGKMGMPFYKVSDMNILGNETEMTNANNYVTEVQIIRNGWSPIEAVPAIIFAKVGAAVMLNRKRLCRAPFLLDNNTMAYSLDESKWDAEFAKALFANVDLTALVQVGALPSYNASDVEGIEISLAPLTEQKQIGRYFKELDNQIYLSQKKLDQLKNLKKALLDKMFV